MKANSVTIGLDPRNTGYTVSFWVYPKDVMPHEEPHCDADDATCDADDAQTRAVLQRRRLLAARQAGAKRFKRRQLAGHAYTVTTVLAFESGADETGPGGNNALVLYDDSKDGLLGHCVATGKTN